MIWLNENGKMIGYVPLLKKEYTEEEILDMSKCNGKDGFSELSKFIMQIQGFTGYYREYYTYYFQHTPIYYPVYRLVDTTFNFYSLDSEIFSLDSNIYLDNHYNDYPNSKLCKYVDWIIEVLENLTLYKVEEYLEDDLYKEIPKVLEQIIKKDTLHLINGDIKWNITHAKYASNYLKDLNKIFIYRGYDLTSNKNIIKDITDDLKEKIYEKREAKQVITLTEHTYI